MAQMTDNQRKKYGAKATKMNEGKTGSCQG
jgi:hypothetical protein